METNKNTNTIALDDGPGRDVWLSCWDRVPILLSSTDTNPKNRSGNPYQRFPERAIWTETETHRHPCGRIVKRSRQVSRWAGSFNHGEWAEIEIEPGGYLH